VPRRDVVESRELEACLASLLTPGRRRDVLRMASRFPDASASIEEMAIIKRGGFAPARPAPSGRVRVVVWNVERGRAPDRWAEIDAVRAADILLLSEIDDGMARSGNLDISAELAQRLGMHYAFAPNYFEFTRGTRAERLATRGQTNLRALHGNAILSRWPLRDVRRIPLPVQFDWFRHYERRIGTRVALRATIDNPVKPLTLAVAHLEAFATPAQRAHQMRVLLGGLDDAPRAIVGGDFNTLGVAPSWSGAIRLLGQRARDVHRFTHSIAEHEPLFEEARRAGFSWKDLNLPKATWRWHRFSPSSLRVRLDWVFGRQVNAEPGSPAVVSPQPRLSDHDGLIVELRL